jgi:protein-tyrosine phosphatase
MDRRRSRLKRTGVALLVVVPFFAWIWNSSPVNLKDRLFPKHLAVVYPDFLYRAGQIDLIEGTLRDRGIEVIVDLTGENGDLAQRTEREAARELNIDYKVFTLGGSGVGAIDQYVGAVEAIARASDEGQRVLVHCRAGDRRTGGVIAAYQILVRGEPAERAVVELERFARKPLDDSLLLPFLLENLDDIAAGLRQRGVALRGSPDALLQRSAGSAAELSSGGR